MIKLTVILSMIGLAFGLMHMKQYNDGIVVGINAPYSGYNGKKKL